MYTDEELKKLMRSTDDIEAFKRMIESQYRERTAANKNWAKHAQTCAQNRKKRKKRKR